MSFHEGSKWQERQEYLKYKGEVKKGKIILKEPKKSPKTVQQYLGLFLSKNGFKPTGEEYCWANDMCIAQTIIYIGL